MAKNLKFLTKQIVTATSFITGIIGYSTLIISYFLPWYLVQLEYAGGGGGPTFIFYSYTSFGGSSYTPYYGLLFGSVFGLLMTIILIISLRKKECPISSSFVILGVLSFSIIIEITYSFRDGPWYGYIGIYYVLYEHYLIGYYLNLIGVIFIIFMIGISLLGFFLFERSKKKSRKQEPSKNPSLSMFSLLLLTAIIIQFFLFKTDWRYYFYYIEISLILITIGILSISVVDLKKHYKSLIPSFLITFFTLFIVRLCIALDHTYCIELFNTYLFYFEIIFILLILSYISFEEISNNSMIVILDYGKKRKSKIFYIIKILYGITIIFLVYSVINSYFYEFISIYDFWKINQEILIIPFIFYLIILILFLFSIIFRYKDDKYDFNHKDLPLNIKIKKTKNLRKTNLFLYIIILIFTIFTYLILRFYNIITEDMTVLIIRNVIPEIITFLPEIFSIFIMINLIPLFIYIGLQVLRLVGIKKGKRKEIHFLDNI